jgi:hypothetical protein
LDRNSWRDHQQQTRFTSVVVRGWFASAALVALCVASGCSNAPSDPDAIPATSIAGARAGTLPDVTDAKGQPMNNLPPIPDDWVESAIAEVLGAGPLSDDEVACVARRVHASPEAKAALGQYGTAVGSPGRAAVVEQQSRCLNEPFAASYAVDLQASTGGMLSDEQVACVREHFVELSKQDMNALAAGATAPDGTEYMRAQEVAAALLAGCGIKQGEASGHG